MEKEESQLNITEEELQRFQNAMKNEEFRKMFADYAREISDPENRKRYEDEIAQLEAERGMDVKFVNPQDGFVVKTSIESEGGMKAFINICQSDAISEATCKESRKNIDEKNVKGQQWSIPYSLNQPREDLDKAGKKCKVYDIIFHTKTYQMGQEHPRFRQLIIDTTFDAIEGNWNVKLDRKNLKYPKLKFKGAKTSTIIRTSNNEGVKSAGADIEIGDKKLPYPCKNMKTDLKDGKPENGVSTANNTDTPKYTIVHRGHLDLQNFTNARDSRASTRPQELVVNIELPLCETSSGVDLDIFEKQLVLDSSNPNYHLDISLPYPVNENEGRAQFDKTKRRLVITLPVIPAPPVVLNGYVDDEAADSSANGLVTEIGHENVDCELNYVVSSGGDDDVNGDVDGHDNNDDDNDNVDVGGGIGGDDINGDVDGHGNNDDDNNDKVDVHGGTDGDDVKSDIDGHGNDHDNNGNVDVHGGIAGDFGSDPRNDVGGGANNDDCENDAVEGTENKMNNFQNDDGERSEDACRKANEEQHSKTNSGVKCPVFKTPPYSFHQNNECVTFVLHVSDVSLVSTSLGFSGNKCYINFPSTSTTTNFLSPGYALYIQFPDECLIDSEKSSVDINNTNVVLVLYKQENCVGTWKCFMIGSDEQTLEKKVFLTEETLKESLDHVKDHWVQQPVTISHQIESVSEEGTVIDVNCCKREHSTVSKNMGNILTNAEELVFDDVPNPRSEDFKNIDTKKDYDGLDAKDDTVLVDYADLQEAEVIERSDEEDDQVNDADEPQRLTTVKEIDLTDEDRNNALTGVAEMQRARAIKCRKNRRRRRRSTGSHESSSFSEEEGDGTTRRGKQRGKHARRQRMSRSLSFGSSAESHDDIEHDGHRCVRFNPVPEVRVFSNKADKRKWKEIRKQQLLSGDTDLDIAMYGKATSETTCKLKSSLKDSREKDRESVSVDTTVITSHDGEEVFSNGCESTDKGIIGDDVADNNDDDHDDDSDGGDNNDDENDDIDYSFVKLDKPQLTNTLIFDLDD